ncbi:hypothetical protein EMPS_03085 [Entomortierella parvispora]|uniref:Xylanolytic transcriptional activator regulatory domain-containing protein n=1 Tax=Entomortierella parvispora TaxID=205924 RepID=A0A9P3LUJ5_9FUNG|nr:hypothetical protein EMPS_03085 [Entomortierella parvispora]
MNIDNDPTDLVSDDTDSASPYTPISFPATPPNRNSLTMNGHANGDHQSSSISSSSSLPTQRHASNTAALITHLSGTSITTPILSNNNTGSESEDQTFATDESMDVLSVLVGSLKVDRDGTASYIPQVLGQKEKSYSDARRYCSTSASEFPDFSALDWESTETPQSYTLPSSLLTSKAIGALMDIYFNSVHTFLPVIHKTSFLTLCQNGEYRVPPFLLMAICAVAARHATDFELQEIPELANLQSHHALYDHARALLDTYMDVPRLSTVQGLLLLAYYQTKEKRQGHFFRIRMYVNLATRMALDMGLQKALRTTANEIESSDTGDSMTSTGTNSRGGLPVHSRLRDVQTRSSVEKRSAMHQENSLAWLGCFFLDGLTSSLMGLEYSITTAALDMRRLIREASQMTDTVQGATLIFWYHHLELVQIYRRVCVFYRGIKNDRVLARAIKGVDMHSIASSLDDWLLNLPPHLVYIDSQIAGAALPSYYTLYLHRFFYSHRLLLYRPLISNKTHRGDPRDPNSPVAKCSQAATMLTQIGEIIFQNYSWPWPGCGLFAYHMLQAAEIHVFQMVTHTTVDAQSLYYRTIDLLKGYMSLAKLPELEKDVASMEEMVSNFLLAPQDPSQSSNFAQQQHFVATPASEYSYASVMSPSSPVESVTRMVMNNGRNMTHSNNQHGSSNNNSNNSNNNHNNSNNNGGHKDSHAEDTDMFSPLQTHAYTSFDANNRGFRQATNGANFLGQHNSLQDAHSLGMTFEMPVESQSQPASSIYDPTGPLPFYSSASSGVPMNMFESHSSHGGLSYTQSSFLQPTLAPVGDLLGLGQIDSRSSVPTSAPSQSAASSMPNGEAPKKKSLVPPPKPPKRILPQSTGSSSSSGVSQSLKPPVPKKPTRLTEMPPPRWIAPRPETTLAPLAVSLIPSSSGSDMYYAGAGGHGGAKPNLGNGHPMVPPSAPGSGASSGPDGGHNRMVKVLQPQQTLYGMGSLVNSLGVEQQVHPPPVEPAPSTTSSRTTYYDNHEEALMYLQSVNPHIYEQPPQRQRPVI